MNIQDELLKCRKWIQLALDKGGDTHDFVDIVDGVISGHMQLWSGAILIRKFCMSFLQVEKKDMELNK